ncbi:MAG: type VI secretion system baseplate subunit TssG [Tabrizicola sp.]|nr:type VI secretion system baseplate subunit TssG [Tabrizicola sp.]
MSTEPKLFRLLQSDPQSFDVLTALRVAEAEAERQGLPLAVESALDGALAGTPISRVVAGPDEIRVEAQILPLTGPLSPLPFAYTEQAARDVRRRAGGLASFLNLFSGRMTRLFADAAEKYRLADMLRWGPGERNMLVAALRGLIGFGTPDLRPRMPVEGDATLRYAGLFAQRTRSALGLQALAETELGLPVRVRQFQRKWRPLPVPEQSRANGSVRLGHDAIAGAFVPDRAGNCRIVVGPVRYGDFLSLEAGQPRIESLRRLARLYLGPIIDFDVQVILDRRDVPQTQLGGDAPAARLGWNAWARSEPAERDSDEAIVAGGHVRDLLAGG